MPFLLSTDTIRRLNDALVPTGLATPDARNELLQGIHPGFVASLPLCSSPLDQVQSDLAQMNQVPALDDDQVPLRLWLENAAARLRRTGRPEAALFEGALAELVRATPPPPIAPSGCAVATLRRIPAWVWVAAGAVAVVLVMLGLFDGPWWPQVTATPTLPSVVAGSMTPYMPEQPTVTPTPQASQTPTPTNEPPWQPPTSPIAFDWVEVPAGDFTMGSDPNQDALAPAYEQPHHTEYVDIFWIARTEVTVAQFAAFVEATGYQTQAEERGFGFTQAESTPVQVPGASWRAPRGPGSSIDDKGSSRNNFPLSPGFFQRFHG